jgi:uncharacterized protein (TIGR00730 family)
MKKICVFGTYKKFAGNEKDEIVRLGRLLAEKGFTVISGGFGGAMEYVSQGAKSAGGKTIGITYYRQKSDKSRKANEFVDKEIRTFDIFDRIKEMIAMSDGFIALPGGTGTLLEIAAVMEHVNKGLIPPKPLIVIGRSWEGVAKDISYEDIFDSEVRKRSALPTCNGLITFVKDADEAVRNISERI